MKSKEGRPYWLFLKEYAFKKKLFPFYLLTIVIIVLTAGVSLVRPELQGKVVDDLGNPQNTNLSAFMFLLGIFLGMLLLNYLMNYAQRYIVAVISEEIAADMRQKVEDKLSTVSVNFFEKIKLSDVLLKVDKDVSAVKQCGITSIITLVSNIVKDRIRIYAMEHPKTEIVLRYPLFNMVERLDFQKKTNRNLDQFTV